MSPLSQAFLAICIEEQSTTSIELIRNAALAKIGTGEVKSIINSSLNGKSYSMSVSKPADEIFVDTTTAIQRFNNLIFTASVVDFSGL